MWPRIGGTLGLGWGGTGPRAESWIPFSKVSGESPCTHCGGCISYVYIAMYRGSTTCTTSAGQCVVQEARPYNYLYTTRQNITCYRKQIYLP